jgi:CheY-like chemotaxis protein
MTANTFAEDVEKSFSAGMNAHITKPLDIRVLHNTIHRLRKG